MHECRKFRLSKLGSFLVRHTRVVILDFEQPINLLERQAGGFNEEIPDDGEKAEIDDAEHQVEFPTEIGNAIWCNLSVLEKWWFKGKEEEQLTNTTTYTKSQFTTIATEEPVLRMCCELISDGYMNGIDKNERP